MARCSPRAGVFLTKDGEQLLSAILEDNTRAVNAASLASFGLVIGAFPPSRRSLLAHVEEVDRNLRSNNLIEYEFRVMEAIRDAFRVTRNATRKTNDASVISETTGVGSVFSRVSKLH